MHGRSGRPPLLIAVSDREITREPIRFFDLTINFNRHDAWEMQFGHTLTAEELAFGVSWYEAVSLCRWLTKITGISDADQAYADPAWLDRALFPAEPEPDRRLETFYTGPLKRTAQRCVPITKA